MRKILFYFLLSSLTLLSGCLGIGGHWMCCAPPSPSSPYGIHWVKDNMTREGRREDSWVCGAAHTAYAADHVVFSEDQLAEKKSLTEKWYDVEKRLGNQWRICMQSKGYVYSDQCDDCCLYP